ncbi:MAG: hypothetical protein JO271_12775 [Verrucomicrobia bacterium]|nr:hypothetical protein [Verrucomicrobiota bacterium]MBV9272997.1 hypothetical protein [Verrucomicrobiota bacterium]
MPRLLQTQGLPDPGSYIQAPQNESAQHWLLKTLALHWAYERGFNCISFEVRAPRSSFRVDIAAYRPARQANSPIIALFECKQSRPDLERDSGQTMSIENELRSLQQRRERLEKLLSIHYPTARVAGGLFPEWDTFDPQQICHTGYRRLTARIVALQRKLDGSRKFERIIRYRLANLHFLVTSNHLLPPERIPPGWGLLEVVGDERLELRVLPRFFQITNPQEWLEAICKSATRRWLRAWITGQSEPVDAACPAIHNGPAFAPPIANH